MKQLLVIAAALAALAGPVRAAPSAPADVLIRRVTVIDVANGRAVPDQAVATRGDTIVAAGPDAAIARAWRARRVVDGRQRFLIPGLWDMHVHFGGGTALIAENKALLPLYVANGVTTVRDASGDLPYEVLGWRQDIAEGRLFGPRLLTSGPKIEGLHPVWKGTLETGSKADVDAAIARLAALKVDFVKITDNTLAPDLFLYAVAQARAAGLRVSGHIPMALTVRQAVDGGLSSIEHLDYAYNAGVPDEARIAADFAAGRIDRAGAEARLAAGFDPATARAAYRDLARRGIAVTPTLNLLRILAYLDRDDHARDEALAYIGPGLRATYDWRNARAAAATPAQVEARHRSYEQVAAILPLLAEAGVPIMAGTDAGFLNSYEYPGFGLHDELELYVRHGLTPAQALASATRTGPQWLGQLDRYGAVEAGKAADLVLLDRDPLADIAATRAIRMVMLRGAVLDRAALDTRLIAARAAVCAWECEAKAH